jgi:hypothetical protein
VWQTKEMLFLLYSFKCLNLLTYQIINMAQTEEKTSNSNLFYIIIIIAAIFFGYLLIQYLKIDEPKKAPKIIKVSDLSLFPSIAIHNIGTLSGIHVKIKSLYGYFIIDTGAEESIFNSQFKDTLRIYFLDSLLIPSVNVSMTDTLEIKVDSLFVLKKTFYSYNLENLTKEINKVDSLSRKKLILGILGQDALNEFGLILNYQNHRVYITKNNKNE